MDLLADIYRLGAKPVFDMRGNNRTSRQYWHDFDQLTGHDIALFNVRLPEGSLYKAEVETGMDFMPLLKVLKICHSRKIIPALQCRPINKKTPIAEQARKTEQFLQNIRGTVFKSKVDRHLIVTDSIEQLPVVAAKWDDLRGVNAGIAFRSDISFLHKTLAAPDFKPADIDIDALIMRLPDSLEERQASWPGAVSTLELARQKLDDPFRGVLVKTGWADVRMDI